MGAETGANVEYFFRLLYDLFSGGAQLFAESANAAYLWIWITAIGYVISILGFGVIMYALIRLYEVRRKEESQLSTLILAPEAGENPRLAHISSLMKSANQNDWRQAIIEADILLDDLLSRQGYEGDGVGEKLQKVERSDMASLSDAWEAHKMRNQIAHEGSALDLSETLARRTIAHYEAVFREFGVT